ncbi:MAG: hypothetical protein ABSF29_09220 [Tepidisphaeraceae bacterium]|jgi:hypothetical protein
MMYRIRRHRNGEIVAIDSCFEIADDRYSKAAGKSARKSLRKPMRQRLVSLRGESRHFAARNKDLHIRLDEKMQDDARSGVDAAMGSTRFESVVACRLFLLSGLNFIFGPGVFGFEK